MRVIRAVKDTSGKFKLMIPTKLDSKESYCFGVEAVKQNVEDRLRIIQGEYYLNTTLGVPLVRNKDVTDLAIQNVILDTEGVSKIKKFTSSLYPNRKYTAYIEIVTETGEDIQIQI